MPRPTPSRVRFALVGVLAVLAVAFTQSDVWSQPGRPPGYPGSGIPGRPPGFGGFGGVTGMPGGIAGMPGGIHGIHGIHGTGISGIGIGGIGGIPQSVWYCSRCGWTQNHPGICPRCSTGGVFGGGGSIQGGMPGPSAPPFHAGVPPGFNGSGPPPGAPPAHTGGLELPPNPTFPTNTPAPGWEPPAPSTTPPSSGSGDSSGILHKSSPTSSGRTAKVLKILGIIVASGVLIGMIAMMVAISKSSPGRPARRTRRVTRDDYDD